MTQPPVLTQSPVFDGAVSGQLVADAAFLPVLLHLARTARTRLWLSQFLVDGRPDKQGADRVRELCHTLAHASHRGVSVRVLLDDLTRGPWGEELNAPARQFPTALGVETRVFLTPQPHNPRKEHLRRSLHSKVTIADDTHALVGSHDLTPNGLLGGNREMSVLVTGSAPVHWLSNWFETLWNQSEPPP
jgi:phosphatidylserine/phosphatidylglycerophosphate/cardiolipin synthase-like enzyme